MTQRFFSGRESWVFRAYALEELCGHHADLIGQVLGLNEHVEYLLYSPRREASGAPFGVRNGTGSHALAVTKDRFVVSRDSHQPGQSPTVCEIPFANILVIELGEALTLGWLVIRFVAQDRIADESIFFQSSGIDHFRAAVRSWRRHAQSSGVREFVPESWEPVWSRTPPYLRNQCEPLLLEEERPRAVLHVAETWRRLAQHRPPVCLSAAALCAVTDSMVLLVQSERPHQPGTLVFAVQVTCLDRRSIRDVAITNPDSPAQPETRLAFDIEAGSVAYRVTMSVGPSAARDVESLLTELRRADVRC